MPESNKTVESIDKGKKRVSFDETSASSRKQKIVHCGGAWVVDVEIETKTLEKNKSVNKQESSSDDKQEEEKKSAKKPVSSSCSDDSENDSDEGEERKHSSEKQSIAPKAEKHDDEPMKPVEAETKNVITRVEYHKVDQLKKPVEAETKDASTMEEYNKPRPLFSPRPGGSRLICMRNLSPSTKESDVVEFFKDAGKIDWVRIKMAGDRFLDFVHVKFDTSEAAQKALKRNGEELNGRPVKLFSAMDGTVNDPVTFSSEHKYLFIGNLHEDVKESDIIEFFKDDGEVVSVRLLHECGDFFGHVEFASSIVARKALRRYGKMLLGRYVELMLATESSVWYSYAPSSRRPPKFGVLSGPGYGPTKNRSSCTTCLRPMV